MNQTNNTPSAETLEQVFENNLGKRKEKKVKGYVHIIFILSLIICASAFAFQTSGIEYELENKKTIYEEKMNHLHMQNNGKQLELDELEPNRLKIEADLKLVTDRINQLKEEKKANSAEFERLAAKRNEVVDIKESLKRLEESKSVPSGK